MPEECECCGGRKVGDNEPPPAKFVKNHTWVVSECPVCSSPEAGWSLEPVFTFPEEEESMNERLWILDHRQFPRNLLIELLLIRAGENFTHDPRSIGSEVTTAIAVDREWIKWPGHITRRINIRHFDTPGYFPASSIAGVIKYLIVDFETDPKILFPEEPVWKSNLQPGIRFDGMGWSCAFCTYRNQYPMDQEEDPGKEWWRVKIPTSFVLGGCIDPNPEELILPPQEMEGV